MRKSYRYECFKFAKEYFSMRNTTSRAKFEFELVKNFGVTKKYAQMIIRQLLDLRVLEMKFNRLTCEYLLVRGKQFDLIENLIAPVRAKG